MPLRGKVGDVGIIDAELVGANLTRGVALIAVQPSWSAPFCRQLISWSATRKRLEQAMNGSALQEIPIAALRSFDIGLPPSFDEQQAIARMLSDADALLVTLNQLIAKKRDLKQAAMQQLLTGQPRLPGFSGEWEQKTLGECLVGHPEYGINAPACPHSDRWPTYIRITDISEDGRFSSANRVSVRSDLSGNYLLREGDIVIARTGASVGKSYQYNPEDGTLVFAGFLIRVHPDVQKLIPEFLAAYLTTTEYWRWVSSMSMRSGQPGINSNEYSQLSIPIPPIEEQTAIAAILTDMDDEIEALEQRLAKTRELKQAMMQELLIGRIRLFPPEARHA